MAEFEPARKVVVNMNGALSKAEDASNWQWLDPELGDYLQRIREKVTELYNDPNNRPLRFFTSHDLGHCQAVEDLIHRLIPRNRHAKLNEREKFYLLASAWLHDIGMLSNVADEVWGEQLNDNEIRRRHHITATRFILKHCYKCGVDEVDRYFLAQLCRFHRKCEDIREADESVLVVNNRFRCRLLAAYLRLADALHVDLTRAPDRDFVYCLAFNMPPERKLHWIKSRLVSGTFADADNHKLEVQFQRPRNLSIRDMELDPSNVNRKIDGIIRYVLDELRDELDSVKHTLTSGGVSYYLDIEKTEADDLDPVTLKHLMTMVMNYDVLVWPSASRLLSIVLENLAEIAGYRLQRGQKPQRVGAILALEDVEANLRRFEKTLGEDIRSQRTHHLGVRALLDDCREFHEQSPFPLEEFVDFLNQKFQRHRDHRSKIRKASYGLAATMPAVETGQRTNVLLYGYSELVMKALCGLRDHRLKTPNLKPRDLYNSSAELDMSQQFRVFICEGQHKTHTAVQDRLMYHDGISYAFALRDRNFTNLVVIPDMAIGATMRRHPVDFLLVGANGFCDDVFYHASGHGSVILLLRGIEQAKLVEKVPRIILVVTSDKYLPRSQRVNAAPEDLSTQGGAIREVDGYSFWTGSNERTRDNIWINRDPRVRADLRAERDHIQFYNPREEAIPISLVDYVVCDLGFFAVRSDDNVATGQNINRFLQAVKSIPPVPKRKRGLA